MASNRSRRLRKKLRIDEFQELGFDISWTFDDASSEAQIDQLVDQFINDVLAPRKLGFHGGGHKAWEGIIATQAIGSCSEADRQAVTAFWDKQALKQLEVGALYDIWWG